MSSLADIRTALATAVTSAMDGVQFSPYMLSNPTPPAGHLYPSDVQYHQAMQGALDYWTFTIQLFVSENAGDIGSQILLDAYLSPAGDRSVIAALEADKTLGGLIDTLIVRSASGYRQYVTQGRAPVLGCEWSVDLFIGGSP